MLFRRLMDNDPKWLMIENDVAVITELILGNGDFAVCWEWFLDLPFAAERTFELARNA